LNELITDLIEDLFQSKGLLQNIELKLRNPEFQTWSRSQKLGTPTRSPSRIRLVAHQLFKEAWNREVPIRLIGVGGKCLEDSQPHQMDLWSFVQEQKEEKILELNRRIKSLL